MLNLQIILSKKKLKTKSQIHILQLYLPQKSVNVKN